MQHLLEIATPRASMRLETFPDFDWYAPEGYTIHLQYAGMELEERMEYYCKKLRQHIQHQGLAIRAFMRWQRKYQGGLKGV